MIDSTLKLTKLIFFFTLIFSCQSKLNKEREEKKPSSFYVGTYTEKGSKGIYKYVLEENGFLKKTALVATTKNPSFLAITKDRKTLLAVNEVNENETGFVSSYAIEKDSLRFVNHTASGGAHPCFITVDKNGNVLVANYTGGNVGLLKANARGKLSELLSIQQHKGKGTTPRQEAPHAHSTWFHPSKKEIISVDLGTNQLWFSKIDTLQKLQFSAPKTLNMPVGAGPRHLEFHPNNKWMYVLNELNNTVSLVKEKGNNYVVAISISTLPEDFTAFSKAADIHISKDGKFLYASNRGHNSIVIYKINPQNGHLKLVGFQSVLGETPRNFSLSPNNNYLLVANQNSNTLVSFRRNETSGGLTFIHKIAAPTPVCLVF